MGDSFLPPISRADPVSGNPFSTPQEAAQGEQILMAKSHFSFKKRKKELERKEKQERKRQRKFGKNAEEPKDSVEES
jgi:hypothetical protein